MAMGAVAVQNKPEIQPLKKPTGLSLPPPPAGAEKQPGTLEQSAEIYRGAVGVLAMVLNPMGLGVNPGAANGSPNLDKAKMPEREQHAKRDHDYKTELKKELAIRLVNARLGSSNAMSQMPNTGFQKQLSTLTSMDGKSGNKSGV